MFVVMAKSYLNHKKTIFKLIKRLAQQNCHIICYPVIRFYFVIFLHLYEYFIPYFLSPIKFGIDMF